MESITTLSSDDFPVRPFVTHSLWHKGDAPSTDTFTDAMHFLLDDRSALAKAIENSSDPDAPRPTNVLPEGVCITKGPKAQQQFVADWMCTPSPAGSLAAWSTYLSGAPGHFVPGASLAECILPSAPFNDGPDGIAFNRSTASFLAVAAGKPAPADRELGVAPRPPKFGAALMMIAPQRVIHDDGDNIEDLNAGWGGDECTCDHTPASDRANCVNCGRFPTLVEMIHTNGCDGVVVPVIEARFATGFFVVIAYPPKTKAPGGAPDAKAFTVLTAPDGGMFPPTMDLSAATRNGLKQIKSGARKGQAQPIFNPDIVKVTLFSGVAPETMTGLLSVVVGGGQLPDLVSALADQAAAYAFEMGVKMPKVRTNRLTLTSDRPGVIPTGTEADINHRTNQPT